MTDPPSKSIERPSPSSFPVFSHLSSMGFFLSRRPASAMILSCRLSR